jgi:RNA polymerase sigma factor (TIGR02999 family)
MSSSARAPAPMNDDVTRILSAIDGGDPHAAAALLPLVYDELRKLAAQRVAQERPGQTLQATALVHEAYLRLVGGSNDNGNGPPQNWSGRGHFFAAAAEAMRRILVEAARRRNALKGGGGHHRVDLADAPEPPAATVAGPPGLDLLALDDALATLERDEPRKAAVVKLRFFAGLTNDEAAAAMGVSGATAENDWAYARAWLRVEMGRAADGRPA